MKYAITFNGYWPVGAVAVVEASDREEAVEKLYNHPSFDPHREHNSILGMYDDALPLVKEVEILLDGSY